MSHFELNPRIRGPLEYEMIVQLALNNLISLFGISPKCAQGGNSLGDPGSSTRYHFQAKIKPQNTYFISVLNENPSPVEALLIFVRRDHDLHLLIIECPRRHHRSCYNHFALQLHSVLPLCKFNLHYKSLLLSVILVSFKMLTSTSTLLARNI